MAILHLKLENQLLSKLNQEVIASGDSNTDKCNFHFSDDWEGYIKTAVFYQDKKKVSYAVLDAEDSCIIPAAAMTCEGDLFIGVFGIRGGEILTSTVESIYLEEGATSGIDIDIKPSDDIFLAIIAQYQAISEQMEYHNETAEQLRAMVKQQNDRLAELNAFDVLEMLEIVRGLQDVTGSHENRIMKLENDVFVLPTHEIKFEEKTVRIEDERITKNSLADLYFDADSFTDATDAEIDGDTKDGYIELNCSYIPEYPLYASIVIRVV